MKSSWTRKVLQLFLARFEYITLHLSNRTVDSPEVALDQAEVLYSTIL